MEEITMMPTSIEREIGSMQATLRAHEARMDRSEAAHAEEIKALHSRFDGVKLHLDKQDAATAKIQGLLNRWMGAIGLGGVLLGFATALLFAAMEGRLWIFK